MAPAAVIISILSSEQHHQSHRESAMFNMKIVPLDFVECWMFVFIYTLKLISKLVYMKPI